MLTGAMYQRWTRHQGLEGPVCKLVDSLLEDKGLMHGAVAGPLACLGGPLCHPPVPSAELGCWGSVAE